MPRTVPDEKGVSRYWEPSEAGVERRDHPLDARREDVGRWTLAPPTSHCWGFRLIDARDADGEGRFARRFGDIGGRGFNRGRSEVHVRFKDKSGGVDSEYKYLFDDHRLAADIFDDLCRAAHPYGAVVYPRLRKAGVPYQQVS